MKKILISLLTILVLASCTSGGSPASIQGQWKLVSFGGPAAQFSVDPEVETSIEFDAEGKLNGNVGCNGFGGEYTVDGTTITFGPVMSTLMFCEAVAEQESITLAVFQEKATFALDGNTLTITSADGASFIVLERK
jgi:heat shock protein HslJ